MKTPCVSNRSRLTSGLVTLVFASFAISSGVAHAVTVYVQFDGPNVVQDPVFASAMGPGYEAYADLQAGEFGAFSTAPSGGPAQNASSGLLLPVSFTNNANAPLVLPAGAIVARIDGTYLLGNLLDSQQQASSTGVLSLSTPNLPRGAIARADHTVARNVSGNGAIVTEAETFTPAFETNGAGVVEYESSLDRVAYDLEMPSVTLAPGETMSLSFVLSTTASAFDAGAATADFLNTATLEIALPPEFDPADLDSDASVPLDFVPEPAFTLLVVIGFAALALLSQRARILSSGGGRAVATRPL